MFAFFLALLKSGVDGKKAHIIDETDEMFTRKWQPKAYLENCVNDQKMAEIPEDKPQNGNFL